MGGERDGWMGGERDGWMGEEKRGWWIREHLGSSVSFCKLSSSSLPAPLWPLSHVVVWYGVVMGE